MSVLFFASDVISSSRDEKGAQREDFKLAIDSARRVERSGCKQSFTLVSSPAPSPPKDDDNEIFIIARGVKENKGMLTAGYQCMDYEFAYVKATRQSPQSE